MGLMGCRDASEFKGTMIQKNRFFMLNPLARHESKTMFLESPFLFSKIQKCAITGLLNEIEKRLFEIDGRLFEKRGTVI